ncbi:SpoIIE family protein phosphatase, partial [Chloroflexota bacterium]
DITERKKSEHAIRERVKELQCSYGVAATIANLSYSIDDICHRIINMIPPGWQYPEITAAMITLNGNIYKTNNYRDAKWELSSDITSKGTIIGKISVVYLKEMPVFDEGPFLEEERNLINYMAEQLAITADSKKAQEALKESEQRNRLLLDSAGDAIYGVDTKGNCIFVNKACLNVLGLSSDADVLGKNMHIISHHTRSDGTPYPGKECQIYHTLQTGEGTHVDDEVFWRSDGSSFPVEYSAYPMLQDDKIVGAVTVFTDITERVLAEEQRLAYQKVTQELATAWEIQESFLPDKLPHIDGWQLAATLKPAKETSGDFYDVISLPDGRYGIVIADVSDKGMPAALYMALSQTLIRTFAVYNTLHPELAVSATNQRLLEDVHTSMFVTLFLGILEPATGKFVYCNAGHNPPYLLRSQNDNGIHELHNTGMVLGVIEDMTWKQETVHMAAGDILLLYTDGITEAQNLQQELFGEKRLMETLQANRKRPAKDIQDSILAKVQEFVGDASQSDDITSMVIIRGLIGGTNQ